MILYENVSRVSPLSPLTPIHPHVAISATSCKQISRSTCRLFFYYVTTSSCIFILNLEFHPCIIVSCHVTQWFLPLYRLLSLLIFIYNLLHKAWRLENFNPTWNSDVMKLDYTILKNTYIYMLMIHLQIIIKISQLTWHCQYNLKNSKAKRQNKAADFVTDQTKNKLCLNSIIFLLKESRY